LTDFGLSKMFGNSGKNWARTNTFAGTAEYLAPEILRNEEYGYEVDWWSFGTLVYEMITGVTPFWDENHSIMYQRVLEDPLEFPKDMTMEVRSFLSALLERNPVKRLGSGQHEAQMIQSHSFFKGIQWDDVYHRRLEIPYVPQVNSTVDLSNFEDCFTSMSPRLSPATHDLSASLQDYFAGYSWAPSAPIGSLSRSMLASSLASSLYGSSHVAGGVNPARGLKNETRNAGFEMAPAAEHHHSTTEDLHNQTKLIGDLASPTHHLPDEDFDLDLTTTMSVTQSFDAPMQLTLNSRVKKPPTTPLIHPNQLSNIPSTLDDSFRLGSQSPKPTGSSLFNGNSGNFSASSTQSNMGAYSSPCSSRQGTPSPPHSLSKTVDPNSLNYHSTKSKDSNSSGGSSIYRKFSPFFSRTQ
jgi:hypothetical protein